MGFKRRIIQDDLDSLEEYVDDCANDLADNIGDLEMKMALMRIRLEQAEHRVRCLEGRS